MKTIAEQVMAHARLEKPSDNEHGYPRMWARVEIAGDRALVTSTGPRSELWFTERLNAVLTIEAVQRGHCASGFVPPSFIYHVSATGRAVFNYRGEPRNSVAGTRGRPVQEAARRAARLGHPSPQDAVCVVFPLRRTADGKLEIAAAVSMISSPAARQAAKEVAPYAVGDQVEWRVAPGLSWNAGRITSIIDDRPDDGIDKPCWSARIDTAEGRHFLGPVLRACVRHRRDDTPAPEPTRIDGLTPTQCYAAFCAAQQDQATFQLELPARLLRVGDVIAIDLEPPESVTPAQVMQHEVSGDSVLLGLRSGNSVWPRHESASALFQVKRSTALTPAQRDCARRMWTALLQHDVEVSARRAVAAAPSVTIANEDLEVEALAGDVRS